MSRLQPETLEARERDIILSSAISFGWQETPWMPGPRRDRVWRAAGVETETGGEAGSKRRQEGARRGRSEARRKRGQFRRVGCGPRGWAERALIARVLRAISQTDRGGGGGAYACMLNGI
ncbi:uncharacterized protein VTP21DRAFT_11014 [Calcarisporiella thermophila]|uniref:uncharacterized protein n=1 Tax=Calcarisporiella thermophila TaxID=911321 RepID=UPI00374412FA